MNYIIYLTFLLLPSFLFGQRTITGKVVDRVSGQPVPGTSVFISNTSNGTVSGKEGDFILNNVPAGKYELIISSVGYETMVHPFTEKDLPLRLRVELEVKMRELQNVTVEPFLEEGWDKWGKTFTDAFIGQTPNAARCRIRNYKQIRFRYFRKSNRVIAYCDEPLLIENKALGYLVRYQLESFEINYKAGSTTYAGYPFFEELDKNRKEIRPRYRKSREQAYSGSMMHFMRSLYTDSLLQQGFETRRMMRIPNAEKERVKKIYRPGLTVRGNGGITISSRPDSLTKDSSAYYSRIMQQKDVNEVFGSAALTLDSLLVGQEGNYKVIHFDHYLYVTYKKEYEAKEYLQHHMESRPVYFQRSYLLLPAAQPFGIERNGNYFPPQEVLSAGYWGWDEKISSLLPLDY